MYKIENGLRRAKPVAPLLPKNFCRQVMIRIEELGIVPGIINTKISTSQFLALLGIGLVFVGAFSGSLASFEIVGSGSLELLDFGGKFFWTFLNYLPLKTILLTLLTTSIAAILIWKSHKWKARLGKIILSVYFSMMAGGVAIAATGINNQIHTWTIDSENGLSFISNFYKEKAAYKIRRDDFLLGKVLEIDQTSATISDPFGEIRKIMLPEGVKLSLNQFVKFAGKTLNNTFHVESFKFCDSKRANMYFNHMKMHSEHMPKHMNRGHMMMN